QAGEMPRHDQADDGRFGPEWRSVLDQEIVRLPEKYRVPLVLCELESLRRKEVAQRLGIAEGTLSSRLATARKLLAKRLARHGLAGRGAAVALWLAQSAASARVAGPLVASTVTAAARVAAGGAAASAVSTKVSALVQGVLKAMFLTKLRRTANLILVAA